MNTKDLATSLIKKVVSDGQTRAPTATAVAATTPTQANATLVQGLDSLAIGSQLMHPGFGQGTVTDITDDTADLDFSNGIKKTLSLQWLYDNIVNT